MQALFDDPIAGSPAPASYPRRVLLAVCGLSPQIVTETLYALAAQQGQPFVPTEVHLITTTNGARRAELSLLSDDMGWFHRLLQDYHLPGVQFDRQHIHVIRDARERGLDDLRTPEDNQAAADFITARVREFTADARCVLHVSIAGGRKTMGSGNFKKQAAEINKPGLFQEAHKLVGRALASADWSADDRKALADMLEQWLPPVAAPWGKDERKKLRLAALRGAA